MRTDGLIKRLRELMDGKSARKFARDAGLNEETFSGLFRQRTKDGPRFETLVKIAEATDVNLNWLMLGKGPMLRTVEARIGKAEMDAAIKDRLDAATLVYLEAMKEAGSPTIDPQLAISLRDQLVFGSIDKAKLVSTLKALTG